MRPLCNTTKEIKRMNKMITVATLLIAAMCQAEEPASAKKGLPHAGRPGHGMPPPEVMKELVAKFDKDGDGKLNETEMKAAREARQAEMLKKYDKDGDGKLSDEEKATAKEAMKKAHEGKPRGERGEGPKGEGRKGGEKKDK
jgi:hypothetical protein